MTTVWTLVTSTGEDHEDRCVEVFSTRAKAVQEFISFTYCMHEDRGEEEDFSSPLEYVEALEDNDQQLPCLEWYHSQQHGREAYAEMFPVTLK